MSSASSRPAIVVDPGRHVFRVARSNFVDPAILQAERERIFDRCWIYLGHGSEIRQPGDFVTRNVAGRSLIFSRDAKGKACALMNTCPHRGAQVCREPKGNAKVFQCFYHGWVFGIDGRLRGQPGEDGYPEGFKGRCESNMQPPPRFDSYRDFHFVCFDAGAPSLADYLGRAREVLDVICDQSERGMAVVPGSHEYSMRANWKLLTENSIDGYHAATTHASYFDVLLNTTGGFNIETDLGGIGVDLGNGHAVIEGKAPWGRPVAQWIPAWGDDGRAEIDAIHARLVEQHGAERAERIAKRNRNLFIFPNLVINDIMAITIRTYFPQAPDHVLINAWALAPVDETAWSRKYRLSNFLEFLGPGGFATPDDVEALEQCQRGYRNAKEVPWNDISKGMNRAQPRADDELQMRAFWTHWNRLMFPDSAPAGSGE